MVNKARTPNQRASSIKRADVCTKAYNVLSSGACPVTCARCSSLNQAEFTSEMMIHFSSPGHLANPGILMFPIVLVCLDCGASHFNAPTRDLRLLPAA